MKALLLAIVTWLSVNFDLPANSDLPEIERLPATQIKEIFYGTDKVDSLRHIVAVYDKNTKTILLSKTWTAETPINLSIIVHEMVHHLQNQAELKFDCPRARERLAYKAQDAWLNLFGTNLSSAFNIDLFTLKVSTLCLPY